MKKNVKSEVKKITPKTKILFWRFYINNFFTNP